MQPLWKQYWGASKIKNRTAIRFSNFTLEYLSEGNKNTNLKTQCSLQHHMFKAIFFLVVISGHESGVIEEAKKSWFFWIVVLGCHNWIESPLGRKEIKPINPKENQPWIFISRTDAEAEAPILLPPDEKSWLIGKDPDAGKYWRQKKKGATEDEIDSITSSVDMNLRKLWELVKDRGAWHAPCPWGCKESDTT